MSPVENDALGFLRLDPWMPEYDGSVQIDAAELEISGSVDASVETLEWKAIGRESAENLAPLYFIDGVRRTEARVLAWSRANLIHGLFGTVAAGVVRSESRQAVFDNCAIRRLLILGGGHNKSETIPVGNVEVVFEGVASAATTPAELTGALQEHMRYLEAELAASILTGPGLVFIDGPLAYITSLGPAIGVVKRISQPYLDSSRFVLVTSLSAGERTPIFLIADGKRDRYSWYLRIGEGRSLDHVLTGIIRLEVRAAVGLESARHLASMSSTLLPRFASFAMRDPRAPQNVVPIGALEQELRRRMGDPLVIRRAIEKRIWEGVKL